jgi:hypothetical protein
MTAISVPAPAPRPWRQTLRHTGYGLLFWLGFLLVLEPANLIHAARAGLDITFSSEALRIACAAALGAAITPGILALSRRFPVRSKDGIRNGAILAASLLAISLAMVLAGALASGWLPPNAIRGGIADQVGRNILLLAAALAVMASAPQLLHARRESLGPPASHSAAIPVKRRGETLLIPPEEIDWIEAQGNYLALHVGGRSHLVRGVLGRMEQALDPGRFARVHRRAIVNLERVRRLRPAASGDAVIDLEGGSELRVSRSYAKALKARLSVGA